MMMNDDAEKKKLDAQQDPEVALKHELRARKDELQRPEATNKSQYVAFVERNWFKAMVLWMNSKHGESPGAIPNHLLCKDGKLDPSKHYGRDFAVVSASIYDRLTLYFRGGPKIVRPYVLSPGTDKPIFIMDPITLTVHVDNQTLKKVVDPKWKIGPLRIQLCSSLKVSKNKSRFLIPFKNDVNNGNSESNSNNNPFISNNTKQNIITNENGQFIIADDNAEIEQIVNKESPALFFNIDPEGRGQEYKRFKTFEKSSLKILSTHDKSSAFLSCAECLLNIPPLMDFILAEGFEHQINPNNKRGSHGEIARSFLALARSRYVPDHPSLKNNENPQIINNVSIDANQLKNALVNKYPELLDFGRFEADGALAALLDGLFEDTNRAQSVEDGSPIADIFLGTLRGSLECPNCHQFEELKERFLFLSLKIPTLDGNEVSLQDCIAHFSVSEEIPDQSRIKCKSCKKLVRSYRTVAVDICPEILIISFQRLSGIGTLSSFVNAPVSYPDEIDIASFASSSSGIYKLICVIFHQGLMEDGKYSCAVLDHQTDKWTYITKDKALVVDKSGAHNGDAMVLFYQKKK